MNGTAPTIALLAALAAPQDPTGHWAGWVALGGDRSWIQVRFDGGAATISDHGARVFDRPMTGLSAAGDRIAFTYGTPAGSVEFAGRWTPARIDGTARIDGGASGTFHLTRLHRVDVAEHDRRLGSYRSASGERIWLFPRHGEGFVMLRDADDWSFEHYLPWRAGAYFARVTTRPCIPPEDWVEFGADRGLTAHDGDAATAARRTDDLGVRRVGWRSGDLRMSGLLLLPPGEGPFATVVAAHGSGPQPSDNAFGLYYALRYRDATGAAILLWDKRGSGRSDGDWEVATYADLAADVAAAVAFARTRPELHPERVGVAGVSQAPSFVLPRNARDDPAIAFVIAISGQVGTIVDADLFNLANRLRRAGHDAAQVEAAIEFMRVAMDLIRDPDDQEEFDRHVDRHRREPWFGIVDAFAKLDTPLAAPPLEQWRQIADDDSAAMWPHVGCPVIQAWGAADVLVDAEQSARRMRAIVAANGRTNFTLKVYPAPVGHGVGIDNESFWADLADWWTREVAVRWE